MAHNPHAPQGHDPAQDAAGSTQMFRAFVEEESPRSRPAPAARQQSSGPRVGVIVGVVVAVLVVAAAAWLALG